MKTILNKIFNAKDLSEEESYQSMNQIMNGTVTSEVISAFLGALSAKGIVKDELLIPLSQNQFKSFTYIFNLFICQVITAR